MNDDSFVQVRPRGNDDLPFYSPARDFNSLVPDIFQIILDQLEKGQGRGIYVAECCRPLSPQLQFEAMLALLRGLTNHKSKHKFAIDPGGISPEEELVKAGFYKLPEAVRFALMAEIGGRLISVYARLLPNNGADGGTVTDKLHKLTSLVGEPVLLLDNPEETERAR